MKVSTDLPKRVEVSDYHEFTTIQTYLRFIVHPAIKVTEIGRIGIKYIGMVHIGEKNSPDNIDYWNMLSANCRETSTTHE